MEAVRTAIEYQPQGAGAEVLSLPHWVFDLVGAGKGELAATPAHLQVQSHHRDGWTLCTTAIRHANELSGDAFRSATLSAYQALSAAARDSATPHFVRFWNFIPDIHRPDAPGTDRYMVFNAGRHAAFESWYGGSASFDRAVPTATGIGFHGSDLVIHGLARAVPGIQVHNPRQQPPFRYSNRFGPLPPCFARATLVQEPRGRLLLVGGTASVCGEDSLHERQLDAQTSETFANLQAVVRAALGQTDAADVPMPNSASASAVSLRDLRVYYRRPEDRGAVGQLVARQVLEGVPVEFCRADICRRELLIEIEGTLWLSNN